MMRIDLLSAVPELLQSPLEHSIIGRARRARHVAIHVHALRDYAKGKHRQIDDYPFGGEAGMVLKPEPICDAIDAIEQQEGAPASEVIFLTPDAPLLTQADCNTLSLAQHMIVIAGHYKGIDHRVREHVVTREYSIGDFVLSGGELPALMLVDAVVRLLPGVLGDSTSALSDSHQDGMLGAPVYTRPAVYRDWEVPPVLLSGDHFKIDAWRERVREERTRTIRPDLYSRND